MQALERHEGVAAALIRNNVDTDAIIPSREMKRVSKVGLGEGLFAHWRYRDAQTREPDPDFILNQPQQAGTSILLAGSNFGCGSSREHAVWALLEYGIRCIIAPSFGAIFYSNCVRNGILPLVLEAEVIARLAALTASDPQRQRLSVDLRAQTLVAPDGQTYAFEIDGGHKRMLCEGLDAIAVTLEQADRIDAFETEDRRRRPWIYLRADTPGSV